MRKSCTVFNLVGLSFPRAILATLYIHLSYIPSPFCPSSLLHIQINSHPPIEGADLTPLSASLLPLLTLHFFPKQSFYHCKNSSDRQSCRQTAVSTLSRSRDNQQVSLNDRQTRPSYVTRRDHNLFRNSRHPPCTIPKRSTRAIMEAHSGYREAPLPRSPSDRGNWGGRDEGARPIDRAERSDTFYRGRSPGT